MKQNRTMKDATAGSYDSSLIVRGVKLFLCVSVREFAFGSRVVFARTTVLSFDKEIVRILYLSNEGRIEERIVKEKEYCLKFIVNFSFNNSVVYFS